MGWHGVNVQQPGPPPVDSDLPGVPGSSPAFGEPSEANAYREPSEATPTSWFGEIGAGVRSLLAPVRDLVTGTMQEGAAGLADPAGMMDRQEAQRELASRFAIVPDGLVGPRLPNQVTEQDFEHVAHEYSDVRLGRGDLTIDTSERTPDEAAQYRAGVMNDVADLLQTDTGRAEVDGLSHNDHGKHTTLMALHEDVNHNGYRGDDGDAAIDTTQAITDATSSDRAAMVDDPPGSGNVVFGPGSDVQLRYNPGVPLYGARSDVVLAHEARHALDETHGQTDHSVVKASDGVPDDADPANPVLRFEHQAIGIGAYAGEAINENHYRAERAAIGAAGAPSAVVPGDANMPQRTSATGPSP